jgi:hypothetical protein
MDGRTEELSARLAKPLHQQHCYCRFVSLDLIDAFRKAVLAIEMVELPPTESAAGIRGYACGYNDALKAVRAIYDNGDPLGIAADIGG